MVGQIWAPLEYSPMLRVMCQRIDRGFTCGSTPCCVSIALQVRHDRRVGADSAVRFMTDGVLMRQLQSDFLLRSYSVILLDEAHERSLNTDLLLGEWLGVGDHKDGCRRACRLALLTCDCFATHFTVMCV